MSNYLSPNQVVANYTQGGEYTSVAHKSLNMVNMTPSAGYRTVGVATLGRTYGVASPFGLSTGLGTFGVNPLAVSYGAVAPVGVGVGAYGITTPLSVGGYVPGAYGVTTPYGLGAYGVASPYGLGVASPYGVGVASPYGVGGYGGVVAPYGVAPGYGYGSGPMTNSKQTVVIQGGTPYTTNGATTTVPNNTRMRQVPDDNKDNGSDKKFTESQSSNDWILYVALFLFLFFYCIQQYPRHHTRHC